MARLSNISLRIQIFIAIISVASVIAISWIGYGVYLSLFAFRTNVDSWLESAATGATEMFAEDTLPKILTGSISQKDYELAQEKLQDFENRLRIDSISILAKNKEGEICYALSTSKNAMSKKDIVEREVEKSFDNISSEFFDDKDAKYEVSTRICLVPTLVADGTQVVITCARLDTMDLFPLLKKSIAFLLAFSLGVVLLAIIITAFLSRRIAMPIKKLSNFTTELAASNFSSDLKLKDALLEKELGSSEVSHLANSISSMQNTLATYIKNLKQETEARKTIESEIKIAGEIQTSFLPCEKWKNDKISISAKMLPARQAAGDFYDFFTLKDGRLSLSVGDVSGKGVAAALFMAKADTILRASLELAKSLPKMAECINEVLCSNNDSCMFLTLFLCAINFDKNELAYVSCGHNPPIIKRANGETFYLNATANIALGIVPETSFVRERIEIKEGDSLILYTDGITEAVSKTGAFYGENRLLEVVKKSKPNASSDEISNAILSDVKQFSADTEQSDDITLLVATLK